MGTGKKENESSTGCVLTTGFQHVMVHSRLVRILHEPFISLISPFWGGESVDMGAQPYILSKCTHFLLLKQRMLAAISLLLLYTYLLLSFIF
jgi:hypothetical protein